MALGQEKTGVAKVSNVLTRYTDTNVQPLCCPSCHASVQGTPHLLSLTFCMDCVFQK